MAITISATLLNPSDLHGSSVAGLDESVVSRYIGSKVGTISFGGSGALTQSYDTYKVLGVPTLSPLVMFIVKYIDAQHYGNYGDKPEFKVSYKDTNTGLNLIAKGTCQFQKTNEGVWYKVGDKWKLAIKEIESPVIIPTTGIFLNTFESIKPYQPIGIGARVAGYKLNIKSNYYKYDNSSSSSDSIIAGLGGTTYDETITYNELKELYNYHVDEYDTYKYFVSPNKTFLPTYDETYFSGILTNISSVQYVVSGWDTDTKQIETNNTSIIIYKGIEIGADFANHFKLTRNQSNEYKTIKTTIENKLSLSRIESPKPLIFTTNNITFSYLPLNGGSSITYTGTITLTDLKSDNDKINASIKTSYDLYDTLNLNDINLDNASLVFSDGYIEPLSNHLNGTITKVCSLGSGNEFTLTEETPSPFTITFTIPTDYYGNIEYSVSIEVSESYNPTYVRSIALKNAKVHFNYNDILTLGDNAILECYNDDGDLIKTYQANELANVLSLPSQYGKAIQLRVDQLITYTLYYNNQYSVEWSITVDYAEPNLIIDATSVKNTYYYGGKYGTSLSLDTTNLVIKQRVHTNSIELGSNTDNTVATQSCEITTPEVSLTTGQKSYVVNITYLNEYNQTLKGSYGILVIYYEPINLSVSGEDTTLYWNNNLDTFHLPTNVTVSKHYSDGTIEEITDLSTLEYYRDINLTDRLIVDESIISLEGGELIYIKDSYNKNTNYDYYNIGFKEDIITKVDLKNNVNFVLGNKPSKYINEFILLVTYQSGRTTETTNYVFKDNSLVMAEKEFVIEYLDQEYTLTSSKITFIKPSIKSVLLNTTKFPLSYNNLIDSIDCNLLEVTVNYVDSEYTEVCKYKNAEVIDGDNQFLVSSNDLIGYNFDGTQTLNIEMDNTYSKTFELTIKVRNKFDTTNIDNNSKSLNISVLEISNLTGITLKKVYTNYNLGEKFLEKDEDDTTLVIYFNDANNKGRKIEMLLKDALPSLNIYPYKGTEFNSVDNDKKVTIRSATNYNVVVEYSITVSPIYNEGENQTKSIVAVKQDFNFDGKDYKDKYALVNAYDEEGNPNTYIDSNTGERKIIASKINEISYFGYLEDINDKSKNARVILFNDYIPPVDGTNNITVTYPCYVEGNADKINKCHFGILFGNNNAKNRLFLSGNPDIPNCDWHSGQIDQNYIDDETMINGNLGYFEDLSYCYYGETDNKVVGYDIVSNDKLLVLKSKSDKETSVYFRTPVLTTAINSSGTAVTGINNETLYQEEFALTQGNNSVAGINNKGIANFNGDTLFISSDYNICGLDLTGIIGDNQRYANSRSYYIDQDLKNQPLDKGWLWTDNQYLFLLLPDKIYISYFETKSNSQYEWWVMNIKDIQSILKINNSLYLGNSNGEIYTFNNNYYDVNKIIIGKGGSTLISAGQTSDTLQVTDEIINKLNTDYDYKFKLINSGNEDTDSIYYEIATVSNVQGDDANFHVDLESNSLILNPLDSNFSAISNSIIESKPVYLNHRENENEIGTLPNDPLATFYKKYYLKLIDSTPETVLLGDSYKLYDYETNKEVDLTNLYRASICYKLDGEYKIININKEEATFQLDNNGIVLNIVRYANQALTRMFQGEIREYKPVEAYYITKPFVLGSLTALKTIWSWTLTNDTGKPSELELAYVSNKIPTNDSQTLAHISKDSLGLDFDNLNFISLDLDKNLVPRTYTNMRTLAMVKFICFALRNNNPTNSILSSLSIIYTMPFPSYGKD